MKKSAVVLLMVFLCMAVSSTAYAQYGRQGQVSLPPACPVRAIVPVRARRFLQPQRRRSHLQRRRSGRVRHGR